MDRIYGEKKSELWNTNTTHRVYRSIFLPILAEGNNNMCINTSQNSKLKKKEKEEEKIVSYLFMNIIYILNATTSV